MFKHALGRRGGKELLCAAGLARWGGRMEVDVNKVVKTIVCCMCSVCLLMSSVVYVQAAPEVSAPSYIVLEASTGQIVCEKDADVRRSPASITKITTLLLIFDHLDTGRIHLEDEVITSAHAKSMGGSQVFLEGTVIIGLNQKTFMGYRLSPIFLP